MARIQGDLTGEFRANGLDIVANINADPSQTGALGHFVSLADVRAAEDNNRHAKSVVVLNDGSGFDINNILGGTIVRSGLAEAIRLLHREEARQKKAASEAMFLAMLDRIAQIDEEMGDNNDRIGQLDEDIDILKNLIERMRNGEPIVLSAREKAIIAEYGANGPIDPQTAQDILDKKRDERDYLRRRNDELAEERDELSTNIGRLKAAAAATDPDATETEQQAGDAAVALAMNPEEQRNLTDQIGLGQDAKHEGLAFLDEETDFFSSGGGLMTEFDLASTGTKLAITDDSQPSTKPTFDTTPKVAL